MKIKKDIALAPFTTFKIGGDAKYFVEASNEQEILEALKWANSRNLPIFILGGGSNLLVDDKGFGGLVIKIKTQPFIVEKNIIKEENDIAYLKVSCFTALSDLVIKTTQEGLVGLEWAVGIPGTVGGAIFGNAGAYGNELADIIVSVNSLKPDNFEIIERSKSECCFDYRDSLFKRNGEIILSAIIHCKRGKKELLMQRMKEIIFARNKREPKLPSAGCVFKNLIMAEQTEEFKKIIPQDLIKGGKLGVGYLIEQCGLKGEKIGGAMVSNEHANFIVNCGGAKSEDVKKLIEKIKNKVREKYKIELQEEIRYLK